MKQEQAWLRDASRGVMSPAHEVMGHEQGLMRHAQAGWGEKEKGIIRHEHEVVGYE